MSPHIPGTIIQPLNKADTVRIRLKRIEYLFIVDQ
jgi:hypothetical protein